MAPQEQGSTQRATQEKKERNLKTSLVNTGVLPAVALFEEDERQAITKGLRHAIEQEQEQGTTQEKERNMKTSVVNTGVLPAVALFDEDERQAITKGLRHAIEQEMSTPSQPSQKNFLPNPAGMLDTTMTMMESTEMKQLLEPGKKGVKKVRDLIQNKDSTLSKENQRFNQLEIEWRSIFRKLDARDGLRDGVIKKQSFLNWVLAMDGDSALNICSEKELTKDCLERLISQIDEDSDGNINQDEWVRLVAVMVTDEENDEVDAPTASDDVENGPKVVVPLNPAKDDDVPTFKQTDGLLYCNLDRQDTEERKRKINIGKVAGDAGLRRDLGRRSVRHRLRKYTKSAAYSEQYRCWPPPIFTPAVSIAQLSVYIYHVIHLTTDEQHLDEQLEITWDGPAPVCSDMIYDPYDRDQIYRYFSYSLVHVGGYHIMFNLLMQLFIGIPLEMSNSFWRVGLVYSGGVVFGSLGTSVFDPYSTLAGASGGVYALITAHLATLILNWKENRLVLRPGIGQSGQNETQATHGELWRIIRLLLVIVFSVTDLFIAFYNSTDSTGYVAHLTGALAGLLLGVVVLKNRKRENWESWLRLVSISIFCTALTAAVIWNCTANMFSPGYFWEDTVDYENTTDYSNTKDDTTTMNATE